MLLSKSSNNFSFLISFPLNYSLLYLIKFNQLCFLTILPLLGGIFVIILISIIFHSKLIFNYEWTCGLTYLPSISRIINLPAERIIWNFLILFHIPLRNYLCKIYLLSGLFDHLFLLLLSIVGERENSELHVIFFSSFLFSTFINFNIHFYLEINLNKKFRFIFLFLLFLLIPLIIFFFSINQLYCSKYSYEIFVLIEYFIVFCIFGFNCCIFFEKHLNCFFIILKIK
ncbi:hypothetical protein Mgra_00009945 [Meloidogyne graminicola]|uniref:CWH43-like N-terminal domain-containing protein n=1 Tax=Meloidogyne graminicola TaxID=189291 RepID=A0A8S9ZAH7_9BILA|nr:hypothetical protein Mgra_00009945 [Meloidogyne graminicola]